MVSIKFFVLCLGFFAINIKKSHAVTDQEKKDVLAVLTPVIVDCSAEHEVTDELLKGLKKSGDYKDVDPCFLACILKKVKLFDAEGKYDVLKAKEVSNKFVSSEDDKKKIGEAIDECSAVNDKDVSDGDKGCERAALLFECMLPHKDLFW